MNVNGDLLKERQTATFNIERLTELLYNGKQMVRKRRHLQNLVKQDKYIQSFTPWWNRTRVEDYDINLKGSVYVNQMMADLNITDSVEQLYFMEAAAPQEVNILGVHLGLFTPTLEKQGTKEQIEKYAKPARDYKIVGAYAQTELGHGTFLRGLETTAMYDTKTEEFIVNSPSLTSMKYWPGAMAKTCNYVIVMAQLYTKGKCHGIHAFVVQIRSLKDHSSLPGVTVGDIGNKQGFGGMDNGFLMFDNVRVPRDSMLMRYAKVERDGTYIAPPNAKVTYGTMVTRRAHIVSEAASCLAKACIIAIRYSAVRRQTEIRPGGEEPQVIDYQTQQQKLFPLLAASYALLFTGHAITQTYMRIAANIEKGQMDEMQVIHAAAAGMKAFSSFVASDGVDRLRMACGGHGYSHASGMPKLFFRITAACTYEGENTVMLLQCARYLVKCFANAARGDQLPGVMAYLNRSPNKTSPLTADLEQTHVIDAFEHVAARLIGVAARKIHSFLQSGVSQEEARNMCSVQLVKAATAHSRAYVVKSFAEVLGGPNLDQNVAKVLQTLWKLYAVNEINENLGEFIQDGFLSGAQADMLMDKMLILFEEIRPNAVSLVDAFDYPDHVLQSCIGKYDGNVYEALYEYARGSPLNKSDVMDSYHTTLRPLMRGTLNQNPPSAKL